jgi:hypothetical protein
MELPQKSPAKFLNTASETQPKISMNILNPLIDFLGK